MCSMRVVGRVLRRSAHQTSSGPVDDRHRAGPPPDRASFFCPVSNAVESQRHFSLNRLKKRGLLASDGAGHSVLLADRRSGGFDELPPSGDGAANIPAHAGDGGWPSARRPHGMELGSGGVAAHVFAPRHLKAGILAEMRPGAMAIRQVPDAWHLCNGAGCQSDLARTPCSVRFGVSLAQVGSTGRRGNPHAFSQRPHDEEEANMNIRSAAFLWAVETVLALPLTAQAQQKRTCPSPVSTSVAWLGVNFSNTLKRLPLLTATRPATLVWTARRAPLACSALATGLRERPPGPRSSLTIVTMGTVNSMRRTKASPSAAMRRNTARW